jgi:transposase
MTRGKIGSLVARMKELKDAVWRFATVKEVPFTNNLAEQAVRMPKVKQKVSGCFRTKKSLDAFCAIRTVTATAKKQGLDALETLTALFCGLRWPRNGGLRERRGEKNHAAKSLAFIRPAA